MCHYWPRRVYILSITRNPWSPSEADEVNPITREEWEAFATADPSLEISQSEYTDYQTEAGLMRVHVVRWVPHPFAGFSWWDGEVRAANPDKATTLKLIEIADHLGARVQGQEGEFYTGPEDYDRYAIY